MTSDISDDKIAVENGNHPGYVHMVNARKYTAMRTTLLAILPSAAPGLTQKEMMDAAKQTADYQVFPNGEKTGWWVKTVQLDLEAKGIVTRVPGKPLRWHLSRPKD